MRVLTAAVLAFALLAAPADAARLFGKARTVVTLPVGDKPEPLHAAPGPNGTALFFADERYVGDGKYRQWLYISRVESGGRMHEFTRTELKLRSAEREYDGGPPHSFLAVGRGWRMVTTELTDKRTYALTIGPDGRRIGRQVLGTNPAAQGVLNTNARGDALTLGDRGFMLSRSAGRFARAPKAFDKRLPRLAADGSFYDIHTEGSHNPSTLLVAHWTGRRWGAAQTVFDQSTELVGVFRFDVVTTPKDDALLWYTHGDPSVLTIRWGRIGRAFGPPADISSSLHSRSEDVQALPDGRFMIQQFDSDEHTFTLWVASAAGRGFRQIAAHTFAEAVDFHVLEPLSGGRTLVVWNDHDPATNSTHRILAAVMDRNGQLGPQQTVASTGAFMVDYSLQRLGPKDHLLTWWEETKTKRRLRVEPIYG